MEGDVTDRSRTGDLVEMLRESMPISVTSLSIGEAGTGLVIVDEVNGFATVGCGNLAPAQENPQVTAMIEETDRLARAFQRTGWPILAFLDTHQPGKPEPPYPPHCERGTGEEELVPALKWLADAPAATLLRKDCINGFVGAIRPDGGNSVTEWINDNCLRRLLVVGICTDICVMDFVLTMLSARNHGLVPSLEDIVVHTEACATYNLPRDIASGLGLPETAAHPQDPAHHMGLYFMASRGAILADRVEIAAASAAAE
ncbi:MAG: isochorismatase family protein [Rhodospirillales bacterium]|nr:MAG: isochorismatase family protein [Rhodospirillales bacterium]